MNFLENTPISFVLAQSVLIIGSIITLFLAILFFVSFRHRGHYQRMLGYGNEFAILLIRVPKEIKPAQENLNVIDEEIAKAETLFSIIGGLRAQRGVAASLKGRLDHFAFEIVALHGTISFYIVVPRQFREFFEQQIHAQYPNAQIEQVEDYNPFTPQGTVVGTELVFRRPYAFPLRTYRQQDGDPLSALTNALSRLNDDESGVIQYVTRSAHPRWHSAGMKISQALRSGKSLAEAVGTGRFKQTTSLLGASFRHAPKQSLTESTPRHPDEALIKALEEKTAKAGLEVVVRLIVSSKGKSHAEQRLRGLVDAFAQFRHYEFGNGFLPTGAHSDHRFMEHFIYRTFNESHQAIVNAEEMSSLFHLPLASTETPNINWLGARSLPAPVNVPKRGIILGENIYRGGRTMVHMQLDDRRRHLYIVGTTGTGKSALLANLALQDIRDGAGVAVVDPHGSTVELILENIPEAREDDVIYFDPSDIDRPIGLNMLEAKTAQEADFAVQEMISIFYKLVSDPSFIGPMFEHNMRNAMLTLMANPEHPGTIVEIPRVFTDPVFQRYSVRFVADPMVRAFWEKEMAKTTDYHKSEMLGYLISKVGRFVENAMVRNIIGQPASGFNFRQIMDERKIFLVNLSKGKIGEMNSNLLGLILVSKLQMAALGRATLSEAERKDFFLYIDEFQNFVTDSIAIILSEARKYRLNLIMAHQYIGQLVTGNDTRVRDAIFGNVGSIVSFRIGVDDAPTLAQQLAPEVSENDLINVERFHAYVRLLIDNSVSKAFSMVTLPPPLGDPDRATRLRVATRLKYGRSRADVEQEVLMRSKLGSTPATVPTARISHA